MNLFFYDVDLDYVNHLKAAEKEKRGRAEFPRRQWVYCNSIEDDIYDYYKYDYVVYDYDRALI